MSAANLKIRAHEVLQRYYGYSSFRPGQWEAIESLLSGRDTIVLMPTGGGKSLCFQIPALMGDGCCIIVSPLVALMNDQVAALRTNGLPAGAIHSLHDEQHNIRTYGEAIAGNLKLLYISPERLLSDLEFIRQKMKVSFIAVDEAHCISQWGHDFRPVYTSLNKIRDIWPELPIMALTATADRLTREDISHALRLEDPFMYVGSFDRRNLSLRVVQGASLKERIDVICNLINRYSLACGIVYCISRKKTEQMAKTLSEKGYRIGCYHAGMPGDERMRVQKEFAEGRLQAVCATIAFGMGIDKSNIRWIVHNNIPGNIESYYQEIGRAGRDGLPAETILFYSFGDIITRRQFAEESGLPEVNIQKLDLMQRYAEAGICRRRILLSYFSEEITSDCGNCDNCLNPRPKFDGTVLAQKALSAIIRTNSNESIGMIIDILRGMNNSTLRAKNYHQLPTYGVGNDLDAPSWHAYILQMIQLGLIEIEYNQNFHLHPTQLGMKVLRMQEKVELSHYIAPASGSRGKRKEKIEATRILTVSEKLDLELRRTRLELAKRYGISDDKVFDDATLGQLILKTPGNPEELIQIEGLNANKVARYCKEILGAIRRAEGKNKTIPGLSTQITATLFNSGLSVEEISKERGLQQNTIVQHLCDSVAAGNFDIDLNRLITPELFRLAEPYLQQIDLICNDLNLEQQREIKDNIRAQFEKETGLSKESLYRAASVRSVAELSTDNNYVLKIKK